ncbi:MAG: FAD-dependent oxidoreductase [Fimbriimonadaceae bacterium]|nr:FAD-dependent oxidoreductase [Chthonomonadaceae bacterium]MCO5296242.1 FAD-dependent oxidoreductase [Fimbriimonadaceae bacterium]
MQPTDVGNPEYYHRVVDCQWACPAHTNVPEYIRLIAQGRFDDAYIVNRESNVFPGILGRTCDRPCEPACRRTRVDGKPVAICRLKRVAADNKQDIRDRLPKAPEKKNGKKIALIGAGPASLTVANDLMPLGYEVTLFEAGPKPGGLMRVNIPAFRLPAEVLDEEIGYILDMGVDIRYNTPVKSLKALLDSDEYDAVFVGSGAPKGKELDIPGRHDSDQVFIGIEWLESIHFGHVDSVGERVIIIGVGNTAMDCCRSAKRLGAKDVKVIARKTRKYFKASPWELEDAEEEHVEILENKSPVQFLVENGTLVGMEFEKFSSVELDGKLVQEPLGHVEIPCDTVILAIGQENAFPWIERDIGLEFNKWDMPVVDETTHMSTRAGVFFGGDAAFGPKNIIWAVEHGHQAAISIHQYCSGRAVTERPPHGSTLASTKMGLHEWAYSNDYAPVMRQKMTHVSMPQRFSNMTIEVEEGFTPEQTRAEVQRCLNCDVETHFTASLCIECDACIDICPTDCLTITENADEMDLRAKLTAPAEVLEQALYVSKDLKQTGRVMVKDENLCLHCGLCAERCPTYAWDMRKFVLHLPYAGRPVPESTLRVVEPAPVS